MWSSTTTTSSTRPCHCLANMPMVAEPQPTRIRSSRAPSTRGGRPDWTSTVAPPSMASVTAPPLHSASSVSQVTRPSRFAPPVRWWTPPSESICEPYSPVVTWPHGLAVDARQRPLGAEVAIRVDLHLDAAVGEDPLGHDRHDVDALDLRGDDEGGGLVVGIGGAGPDGGDEGPGLAHDRAVPIGRPPPRRARRACRPRWPAPARHAGRPAPAGRPHWRSGRRRRAGPAG